MLPGPQDEATNDHLTSELCVEQILQCQRRSAGVSFITLCAEKYGFRPLPRR